MKTNTTHPITLFLFHRAMRLEHPSYPVIFFKILIFWMTILIADSAIGQGTSTYIVTKTVDTNGICESGNCSLREAIIAANSDNTPSIIKFDFASGSAPFTILVRGTPLPILFADDTRIDGLLDNNYDLGDVIVDGRLLAGTVDGFGIQGDDVRIGGLQIQNFTGNGINAGATFATISVRISNSIIVDNDNNGIFIPVNTDLVVTNSYIGTNPSFSGSLGNGGTGILYNSILPGTPTLDITDNAISSNSSGGVRADGRVAFSVSDNVIGTNPSGTLIRSNGTIGILVTNNNSSGTIDNNIIGYNGRAITVASSTPTRISRNSLFCNASGGIIRSGSPIDLDITNATSTEISGTSSIGGGTVEVFIQDVDNCPAGVPNPCQGRTFVGATTSAANGNWSLNVSGSVSTGDVITATVTTNAIFPTTSNYAACQTIACPTITVDVDETPTCAAANSGSLTANPTGGSTPYSFIWSTGATTATISNLPPGAYSLTVVDADGCRAVGGGEVDEIARPTANAGPDQLICAGEEATLTATASGGTGPYAFNWEPGGAGASITVSPSESTFYTVSVTDSQGCTDRDQLVVRVGSAPQQPDAGPDQSLCGGQTTTLQGDIGGDPAAPGIWTASVAGGTFFPNATTLNATYTPPAGATQITLTLSTTNGSAQCPDLSDDMVITYTEAPTANAGPDQLICAGSETTLTATASGGVGPYTFVWEPGGAGASINVSPGSSTVYSVTATDSQGCEGIDQVNVRVGSAPQQPDAGPDQSLCAGQMASLQGNIGDDPNALGIWTASLAGGTFSPNPNTLNATYTPPSGATQVTLTLTTNSGSAECPDLSDDMTIIYSDGPIVDAGPDQNICTDAPATLAGIIGGNGVSGGWSASVAGGTFSPDNLAPDAIYTPPPGASTVILTLLAVDASGLGLCPDVRDQMTITYTDNGATVDAGPSQIVCEGVVLLLSGSIGGTATSTEWSTDGDGIFANINELETTYTPGVEDIAKQGATLSLSANSTAGCPPVSDNVDFRIIAAPVYTVSGIDPSTCGDPDGSIIISGLLPGAAYDFSYILGEALVLMSQDASAAGEIRIDNLGDGTYSNITVTDSNGCSGTPETVVLTSPDGPTAGAAPITICLGSTGELVGNAGGGTPPYTHQWQDQATGAATAYNLSGLTFQTLNIDASIAQAGTVDLLYQVTDSNGCTASVTVTVSITAGPEITISQLDSASLVTAVDGRAEFNISGGQPPYNYSWTGPSTGTANQATVGNAIIEGLRTGNYSLLLSDANGCSTTSRFRIGVLSTGGGECTTDAGSLEEVTNGVIQSCSSNAVALVHNGDQFLDANDALIFVLKEMSGVVIKTNTEPVFEYDPASMTLNTAYLAAARAGNATGPAGTVDPADPCLSESNTVNIVFQESLTGVLNFLQGEETLCQGEELILSTNNLGSVDYFWITPGRDTIRTNEPMVILPNIRTEDAGNYFVIARDGDCLNDQTGPFALIVNGLPVGTPLCAGDDQTVCDRTVNLEACDPGPGIGTWTSLSGANINNAGNASTTASDLVPGENLFVWTVEIPECGSIGSDTVRVVYESSLFAQPDAFILERANTEIFMDVLKNDNIAAGADIELTALTEPAFGILETLSNGFRFYETEQRRGTVEFVYQVCYLGGTCMGTCDTATVIIDVLNLPYLPEGITPDGDGRNDELNVLGYTPGDSDLRLQLTIANQWGEIIFQSNDYTNSEPWKGQFNGKPVPQGAYYCHLETIVEEGSFERTQTVYVVR